MDKELQTTGIVLAFFGFIGLVGTPARNSISGITGIEDSTLIFASIMGIIIGIGLFILGLGGRKASR